MKFTGDISVVVRGKVNGSDVCLVVDQDNTTVLEGQFEELSVRVGVQRQNEEGWDEMQMLETEVHIVDKSSVTSENSTM